MRVGGRTTSCVYLLSELRGRHLLLDVIINTAAISACEKGHTPQLALHVAVVAAQGPLAGRYHLRLGLQRMREGSKATAGAAYQQKLQLRGLLPSVIPYNMTPAHAQGAKSHSTRCICGRSCGSVASERAESPKARPSAHSRRGKEPQHALHVLQ